MKAVIVENKSDPTRIQYPCLMISQEDVLSKRVEPLVVMFVNEWQGVVISAPKNDLADYRESEFNGNFDWSEANTCIKFVPFIGEITLTGE